MNAKWNIIRALSNYSKLYPKNYIHIEYYYIPLMQCSRNYPKRHSPSKTTDYWHFSFVNRWIFSRPVCVCFFLLLPHLPRSIRTSCIRFAFNSVGIRLGVINSFDESCLHTCSTKRERLSGPMITYATGIIYFFFFCWRFMYMNSLFFIHFPSVQINVDIIFYFDGLDHQ